MRLSELSSKPNLELLTKQGESTLCSPFLADHLLLWFLSQLF